MARKKKPTPEAEVDQFLAAPDTVRRNAAELRKARERKAREVARERQVLASKSKSSPSIEDMLADVVRVAEDEETNPWHEFRSISRRRYELYGYFPVRFVDQQFGTFAHALEVAGLRDQVGTRMWRANRAAESRREHAARYVERYVHPYVETRAARRELREDYLLLSISDTHSQFLCPFVWLSFLSAIRDLKPDGVLFNGDVLEGAEVSRYPKIPGWTRPLQEELDFTREMFRQVRDHHDGDLFYTGGNHGVDRLASYLTQVAPSLANLRTLRVDKLLGLDDLDVRILQGGTISSPVGTEDDKPGFLLFGSYRIHHGTRLGQSPAREELLAAGRSGQSGHVHRAMIYYGTTEATEGMSWMCTPMGCRHEAGRAYVKSPNTGWQRGFGIARLRADGSVHQYPVVVAGSPERVSVEGYTYVRPAKLTDPRPEGVWVSEVRLPR